MAKLTADLQHEIDQMVSLALNEDIGDGDLTASLIAPSVKMQAQVIAKEEAIICGIDWFNALFNRVDALVTVIWHVAEGEAVSKGARLCDIEGSARSILTAERSALNFLQMLSGTATTTNQYVKQLEGLKTRVLDTRKTIPGYRLGQKYAVNVGGGKNHRVGLYDGVLIKENHIAAAGSISAAVAQVDAVAKEGCLVEVEVESLDELAQAISAGVQRIMLDNFSLDMMREAVTINQGYAELEASGDITLDNIRQVAQTGVDYISVGAITKHIRAIDLSMRILAESV